jgi:hypothetical protein
MRSTCAMETVARWGLAVIWFAVAWSMLRGKRVAGSAICATVALALAAAAAFRWHVSLLYAARRILRDLGAYDGRIVAKFVIASVVVLVAAAASRWVWRQPEALRGALSVVLGFAAYLACYTVLLDAYVPAFFGRPPGRQLLELAFAAPALYFGVRWRNASPQC